MELRRQATPQGHETANMDRSGAFKREVELAYEKAGQPAREDELALCPRNM